MANDRSGRGGALVVRRREWAEVRRVGWRVLLGPALGVAIAGGLLVIPGRTSAFLAGVVCTTMVLLTAFLVMQGAGTTQQRAGIDAEVLASHELRRLGRRGWAHLDHLPIRDKRSSRDDPRFFDVDHVVIGDGVAFAIETKWRSGGWSAADPHGDLSRALTGARESARQVRLHLPASDQARDVLPMLVVAGRLGDLTTPEDRDGVRVLHYSDLRSWCAGLPTVPEARRSEVAAVGDHLRHLAHQRDPYETGTDAGWYVRHGPVDVMQRAAFGLISWALTIGAVALLASAHLWLALALAITLLLGAPVIAWWVVRWRAPAVGAALGAATLLGWALVSVVAS